MAAIAAVIPLRNARNERNFKERITLDSLRDSEILSRYRLSRGAILTLVESVRGHLERTTRRSSAIPVLTQVLVGLRFLAKGDFLSEVADIHGISRSSACNIIDDFVDAVNAVLDNIRFPEGRNVLEVKHGFFGRCGIPNTVGAIDGTLIAIQAPTINEEAYVCRKNYHAINVQAVVDHKARFIDAVSKWPGSTHDASMFENSGLKVHMEQGHIGHLLGDSGYALKRYLLTPLMNPQTRAERAYNHAQSVGRMVVERAFGLLKSRFRCLHKTGGCLVLKPNKCCRVITACMRLHNLCMDMNVPAPDIPVNNDDGGNGDGGNDQQDAGAAAYRQTVIRLFDN